MVDPAAEAAVLGPVVTAAVLPVAQPNDEDNDDDAVGSGGTAALWIAAKVRFIPLLRLAVINFADAADIFRSSALILLLLLLLMVGNEGKSSFS